MIFQEALENGIFGNVENLAELGLTFGFKITYRSDAFGYDTAEGHSYETLDKCLEEYNEYVAKISGELSPNVFNSFEIYEVTEYTNGLTKTTVLSQKKTLSGTTGGGKTEVNNRGGITASATRNPNDIVIDKQGNEYRITSIKMERGEFSKYGNTYATYKIEAERNVTLPSYATTKPKF